MQPFAAPLIFQQASFGQRRADKTGREQVDLNVISRPLDRHHACQLPEASFGCAIDRDAVKAIAGVKRPNVDDLATTLRGHDRPGSLTEKVGTAQVDPHNRLPIIGSHLGNRFAPIHPSTIH